MSVNNKKNIILSYSFKNGDICAGPKPTPNRWEERIFAVTKIQETQLFHYNRHAILPQHDLIY